MTRDWRQVRSLQIWLICAVLAAGCGASALLCRTLRNGYAELRARSTAGSLERTRAVQFAATAETLRWNQLVLRGHDGAELVKLASQFREEEAAVRELVRQLQAELVSDVEGQRWLDRFLESHAERSRQSAAALDVIEAVGRVDDQNADMLVRGRDVVADAGLERLAAHLATERQYARQRLDALVVRASGLFALLGLIITAALSACLLWTGRATPESGAARAPRSFTFWRVLTHAQR